MCFCSGLGSGPDRIFSLLLRWRVFLSSGLLHERHKPRPHPASGQYSDDAHLTLFIHTTILTSPHNVDQNQIKCPIRFVKHEVYHVGFFKDFIGNNTTKQLTQNLMFCANLPPKLLFLIKIVVNTVNKSCSSWFTESFSSLIVVSKQL